MVVAPKIDLQSMITESRNPSSSDIDTVSTVEMLKIINAEDKKVPIAVEKILPEITTVVDIIVDRFKHGGRLVYIGAGTSGRLGILDASECPPTYGTSPGQVIAFIAGGEKAILHAVENAEDKPELGVQDLKSIDFNKNDVLIGIAASGRTPYVKGALEYANELGATTAYLGCNPKGELATIAKINLVPVVGPEVITGSSRMKAGTAQKLVLNMLTTGSMIKSGKVYGNLMVDVESTNEKLVARQKKIVMDATECSYEVAEKALNEADGHCKTAIVMVLTNQDANIARSLLAKHNGFIRAAIEEE
ncbi:N-acetylmuramic acid 6-phosphate etherase [Thorsellia anophelis]|uniref:N-acetylmuramic acid 6-phosphate etherase n=1 Tax=Thorsellia anophelis DSM 18579 TaxID=1123402 RepID=A0A1I0DEX1_9GAMM|nr:N-acetylmuramic acid 6-phosphate etherase [Thorsellia anophelis]SET30282.1 N-acetylmuramic acid 6-phosphate etherase [Thorsellia anophelis DSM 18579]